MTLRTSSDPLATSPGIQESTAGCMLAPRGAGLYTAMFHPTRAPAGNRPSNGTRSSYTAPGFHGANVRTDVLAFNTNFGSCRSVAEINHRSEEHTSELQSPCNLV